MMISTVQMLANCWCLIYHAATLSFASPAIHPSNETEVAPSKSWVKPEVVSEQVVNFFNPVTCQPKENQKLVPCHAGEDINKTLCLEHKCCVSSKKHVQLDCYSPLKDRGQRVLRLFGVGLIGVFLIGCLPFCCCIVEKSPCCNPLRRAPKAEESDEDSDSSDEDSDSSDEDSDSQ